jgi:hypothetical protein
MAVSETPAAPPPATPPPAAAERSLLQIGSMITLAAVAFAAVIGVIAVVDTDSSPAGFGVGFGIALLIFLAGATLACGLACLVRGRAEVVALAAIAASCIALDLIVLAIWLEIDNEAYGKTAAVAFVWSLFALVVLGLALAVAPPERLALALYSSVVGLAVLGGLISTWLILTAENNDIAATATPVEALPSSDDGLLRVLGVILVLMAALWFGALAASRLPDQTLKRTLTTSPSSTT